MAGVLDLRSSSVEGRVKHQEISVKMVACKLDECPYLIKESRQVNDLKLEACRDLSSTQWCRWANRQDHP